MSARIRSHSRQGPSRPYVPPDHGCDGGTVFSISSIQLADLGGNRSWLLIVSDPLLILPGDYFYSIMLRRHAFRNCVLAPKRSERSAPAYWQVRLSERYNAGAEPQP